MQKRKTAEGWPLIEGVRKFIYCTSCGKKIKVNSLNRRLCSKCGYRENRGLKDD